MMSVASFGASAECRGVVAGVAAGANSRQRCGGRTLHGCGFTGPRCSQQTVLRARHHGRARTCASNRLHVVTHAAAAGGSDGGVDSARVAAVQQQLRELNAEAKQLAIRLDAARDAWLGAKPDDRSAYKDAYSDLQQQLVDVNAMRKDLQAYLLPGAARSGGFKPPLSAEDDARWAAIKAPSGIDPAAEQTGGAPLLRNWRPAPNAGLPPALASPIFGRFADAVSSTTEPSKEDMLAATELCDIASSYHEYESDLETYLHGFLHTHLGLRIHKERPRPKSRMATDGCTTVKPQRDPLSWCLCTVLEAKLEIGSKGDSNFQGAAYYGIFWQARQHSPFLQRTCCPALLLEVVGPHLRVSALYWLQQVVVRPLTPFVNLLWFADDHDHMKSVARILAAIRSAQQELSALYSSSAQPPNSTIASRPAFLQQGMPYPMAEYDEPAGIASGKRIHAATVPSSGQHVVVRFVRQYGVDAHAAWAAAGLAPQLHQVKQLPGGWLQVEMEMLERDSGWYELGNCPAEDVAAATSAAQAALQQAHQVRGPEQQAFAHGDARVQNVMVRRVGQLFDVRFVDFEYAGEDGKQLYPAYMSPRVQWPAGVEYGKPLLQSHDTTLLAASCQQLISVAAGSKLKPSKQAAKRSSKMRRND